MKEVKIKLEEDTKDWENTARLITANEVAKITKHPTFDATQTGQSWFCLDTNQPDNTTDSTNYCAKAQGTSKYAWLFDYTYECTNSGCNTSDSSNWGYWTSSPYKSISNSYVHRISSYGGLTQDVANIVGSGVRPVITISKSNI